MEASAHRIFGDALGLSGPDVILKALRERGPITVAQDTSALSPCVFHRNGQPVGDFRKAWARACAAAGVAGTLFHDLRRSAVRNFEKAGVSQSVAMKISGHKTASVYRRYRVVDEQDIADALVRTQAARPPASSARITPLRPASEAKG